MLQPHNTNWKETLAVDEGVLGAGDSDDLLGVDVDDGSGADRDRHPGADKEIMGTGHAMEYDMILLTYSAVRIT